MKGRRVRVREGPHAGMTGTVVDDNEPSRPEVGDFRVKWDASGNVTWVRKAAVEHAYGE